MIVRYSFYVSLNGALRRDKDPDGKWLRVSDVIAAMEGAAREIYASPSDDPETVLKRVAIALEARRERITELQIELARRNRLIEGLTEGVIE